MLVEEPINGRPDIIAKKEGKRITIEIETGKSDVVGNIQRALETGFYKLICIVTNEKIQNVISRGLIKSWNLLPQNTNYFRSGNLQNANQSKRNHLSTIQSGFVEIDYVWWNY